MSDGRHIAYPVKRLARLPAGIKNKTKHVRRRMNILVGVNVYLAQWIRLGDIAIYEASVLMTWHSCMESILDWSQRQERRVPSIQSTITYLWARLSFDPESDELSQIYSHVTHAWISVYNFQPNGNSQRLTCPVILQTHTVMGYSVESYLCWNL